MQASQLQMKSFVDIEGSGRTCTVLKNTAPEALRGAINAALRDLTIEGGSVFNPWRMERVEVKGSGVSVVARFVYGPPLETSYRVYLSDVELRGQLALNGLVDLFVDRASIVTDTPSSAVSLQGIDNRGASNVGKAELRNVKVQGVIQGIFAEDMKSLILQDVIVTLDTSNPYAYAAIEIKRGVSVAMHNVRADGPMCLTINGVPYVGGETETIVSDSYFVVPDSFAGPAILVTANGGSTFKNVSADAGATSGKAVMSLQNGAAVRVLQGSYFGDIDNQGGTIYAGGSQLTGTISSSANAVLINCFDEFFGPAN
jgi:hypothetical protein